MSRYDIQPIHKISNTPAEKAGCRMTRVEIRDGAFSDRRALAKALREARVLPSGGRLLGFRVEGDRVVAFPAASVWHSFILTRLEDGVLR